MTLGMVFCDTGKVSTKEERLEWPVTDEERDGEKGWGRFQKEQVCRLRIRRMKEEWAKDLIVRPWCISEVIEAREDCPELQAVLDEYHRPVVIQDEVLGELTLDKDFGSFEGEVRWRESHPGHVPAAPPRICWPTVRPGTRRCGSLRQRT